MNMARVKWLYREETAPVSFVFTWDASGEDKFIWW